MNLKTNKEMIAAIDADSLIYIIAWNHREHSDEVPVKQSCDSFIRDILLSAGCDSYIGVFSDHKNFRHRIYKRDPYKGNRPEKEEWMKRWELVIKEYFTTKYGFLYAIDLEADDVVAAAALLYPDLYVICSPDKDLNQIPGYHYNYKSSSDDNKVPVGVVKIKPEDANRFFWNQMLVGDKGDNIAGVPGMGDVKAKKYLDTALDPMMYLSMTLTAYKNYYGDHYGGKIWQETHDTLKMMGPEHEYWFDPMPSNTIKSFLSYQEYIRSIFDTSIKTLPKYLGMFD